MLTDGQVEAFNEGRVDAPAVRGQQQLGHGVDGCPDPVWRAGEALHRFSCTDLTRLDRSRRAKSSSSCTCVTCTSCKKYWEKAVACSATSTSHARTVVGSTANTRATARMPKPSASAPTAHTSRSGATRLPCNGVPWVSWKEPSQAVQENCRLPCKF